jgi:hypothetical protein
MQAIDRGPPFISPTANIKIVGARLAALPKSISALSAIKGFVRKHDMNKADKFLIVTDAIRNASK